MYCLRGLYRSTSPSAVSLYLLVLNSASYSESNQSKQYKIKIRTHNQSMANLIESNPGKSHSVARGYRRSCRTHREACHLREVGSGCQVKNINIIERSISVEAPKEEETAICEDSFMVSSRRRWFTQYETRARLILKAH